MLEIILCDDDPFILQLSADKINELIRTQGFQAKIASLASGSGELFSYLKRNPSQQYLIFLDLDFGRGRLNGLDVARALRQTRNSSKIVFITNHSEMAMEVLKSGVEPFGFLEKSSDIHKLSDGYRRYIAMLLPKGGLDAAERRETEISAETILLNPGFGEEILVPLDDIVYVETEKNISHGITYHTVNGSVITVIGTLDAERKKLGDGFLRVHRSYLVNQRHVLGLREGFLKLSSQREIPCAFRMRSEVRKWLA